MKPRSRVGYVSNLKQGWREIDVYIYLTAAGQTSWVTYRIPEECEIYAT